MKKNIIILLLSILLFSCMEDLRREITEFDKSKGLFITNEGNFMYGNASLSYYNPDTKEVENDVFYRANAIALGDVAQSICLHGELAYIVVNNSNVIFAIDSKSFKLKGMIKGLVSPRYIHFISDTKAYVTDLYEMAITIVNPSTFSIIKKIDLKVKGKNQHPTEQMVQYKNFLFINCWSFDNKILVLDTNTDTIVEEIEVPIQPTSLCIDKYNKIWTVSDGGFEGSPYGHEAPSLVCIDAETRKIERKFTFKFGDWPSELCMNGTKDTLYFINKDIWRMDTKAKEFPKQAFIASRGTKYYGLTVNPSNGDVYLADAIDYVQRGVVYRYSYKGEEIDRFKVGIIPGSFCFKN